MCRIVKNFDHAIFFEQFFFSHVKDIPNAISAVVFNGKMSTRLTNAGSEHLFIVRKKSRYENYSRLSGVGGNARR